MMDFVTGFPILSDWVEDICNTILVIINCLTIIVYYKLMKITIDLTGPAEVIINVVIRYYGLLKLIVNDKGSLLNSKF